MGPCGNMLADEGRDLGTVVAADKELGRLDSHAAGGHAFQNTSQRVTYSSIAGLSEASATRQVVVSNPLFGKLASIEVQTKSA